MQCKIIKKNRFWSMCIVQTLTIPWFSLDCCSKLGNSFIDIFSIGILEFLIDEFNQFIAQLPNTFHGKIVGFSVFYENKFDVLFSQKIFQFLECTQDGNQQL